MRVMGIDNGIGGGIVVVDEEVVICKAPMPVIKLKKRSVYDMDVIVAMIRSAAPVHVFIEKGSSHAKTGGYGHVSLRRGVWYHSGYCCSIGDPPYSCDTASVAEGYV